MQINLTPINKWMLVSNNEDFEWTYKRYVLCKFLDRYVTVNDPDCQEDLDEAIEQENWTLDEGWHYAKEIEPLPQPKFNNLDDVDYSNWEVSWGMYSNWYRNPADYIKDSLMRYKDKSVDGLSLIRQIDNPDNCFDLVDCIRTERLMTQAEAIEFVYHLLDSGTTMMFRSESNSWIGFYFPVHMSMSSLEYSVDGPHGNWKKFMIEEDM